MALITIATDDMNEAQRMLRALMDPTKAATEVVVTAPGGAEPTPATEASKPPRGRAPRAAGPEPSGSPASEAPAMAPPPMPFSAPPPVPTPAPILAPSPIVAPPPPPEAPAGDSAAAPGWTLEHVKTLATTFLRDPRGGPERLKPILDRHGITAVPNTPPHLWHIVYQEMQAVLEAS